MSLISLCPTCGEVIYTSARGAKHNCCCAETMACHVSHCSLVLPHQSPSVASLDCKPLRQQPSFHSVFVQRLARRSPWSQDQACQALLLKSSSRSSGPPFTGLPPFLLVRLRLCCWKALGALRRAGTERQRFARHCQVSYRIRDVGLDRTSRRGAWGEGLPSWLRSFVRVFADFRWERQSLPTLCSPAGRGIQLPRLLVAVGNAASCFLPRVTNCLSLAVGLFVKPVK